MYFIYLLKILLHQSTSTFGSGIHICVRLFSRKIRSHISMLTILYNSMAHIKYFLVMEWIMPISYPNPGIFFWGYCQSYWSYITRSQYSIFRYLHDFPNVCTDSTHSYTLEFTHSCFYLYYFLYPPMNKVLSMNWTTKP